MDIYLLLYLVFIVAPAGTAVHEFGHMVGAKLVEAEKMSLTIGTGKIVYRKTWKQMDIIVRVLFFIGGMACSEREKPYRPHEQIRIAALGPISSVLAAGICCGLYVLYPSSYLLLPLLFNLWVAVINVIPFRFRDRQSDGYAICKAIRQT